MSSGATYVAAAYGVMGFSLVIYVVAAGMKRARLMREAELLNRLQRSRDEGNVPADAGQSTLEAIDK